MKYIIILLLFTACYTECSRACQAEGGTRNSLSVYGYRKDTVDIKGHNLKLVPSTASVPQHTGDVLQTTPRKGI